MNIIAINKLSAKLEVSAKNPKCLIFQTPKTKKEKKVMKKVTLILAVIILAVFTNIFAQETKDIDGAKDNPLISRLENSYLAYFKTVKWDTYILPISKIIKVNGQNAWKKKLKLEGQINRIQYTTTKENSAAFVYANYLSALKKSHWEILFSGNGDNELGNSCYEWQYSMFQEGLGLDDKFGSKYNFRGDDYAYITAKYEENDSSYYAMIYIVEKDNFTLITQDIIKVKNPDLGLVTAKLLTEQINKKGHLALEGIFFETGKATLTDKSSFALNNIAEYLNSHKDSKFFIVGHTDNVGNFKSNMILSENRAKAVMKKLILKYNVNPKQLKSYGVANLSPVASNKTDKGKARNRRVEIVEQ